jgi:hypothetical protein
MEKATSQLTEEEVRDRLEIAKDQPEVIDELYDFGRSLANHVAEDIQRIDSKAASFAAYSGAVLTLLVSTVGVWSRFGDTRTYLLVLGSGLALLAAAVLSVVGLAVRKFAWFSQEDWLERSCLKDIQELKRHRILTMWGVTNSYRTNHRSKAKWLGVAQWVLILAFTLLLLGFLSALWGYHVRGSLRFP